MNHHSLIARLQAQGLYSRNLVAFQGNASSDDPSASQAGWTIVQRLNDYAVFSDGGRGTSDVATQQSGAAAIFATEEEACDFIWRRVVRLTTNTEPAATMTTEEQKEFDREARDQFAQRMKAHFDSSSD